MGSHWHSGPENWADIYNDDGALVALVTKGRLSSEPDAALVKNAPRLQRVLQRIIDTTNVRIDDPRSEIFDEARAALKEISAAQTRANKLNAEGK